MKFLFFIFSYGDGTLTDSMFYFSCRFIFLSLVLVLAGCFVAVFYFDGLFEICVADDFVRFLDSLSTVDLVLECMFLKITII